LFSHNIVSILTQDFFPPSIFLYFIVLNLLFVIFPHIHTESFFLHRHTIYIHTHKLCFTCAELIFFSSLSLYIYTHTHRILCLSFGVSVREPGGKKNLI
jgi:hypothetical protein